jgi:tRNA dimethylallyltransferase
MMADGLLDEVKRLAATTTLSREARQALGYNELLQHLEGRLSLDEAVAQIVLHTRQFAVRQERWFRRDPRIEWVVVQHDPVAEVAPKVLSALRRSRDKI